MGLVEWSQVLVLALASRRWLIGSDLNARLQERRPGRLFQGGACLALVLMEELAWGQVIFSWRTPPLLNEINAQNETTLHNIGWFQDILLDLGTFSGDPWGFGCCGSGAALVDIFEALTRN